MKSLIVEDDALARALLHALLERYGTCHTAVDGEEAVTLVRRALAEKSPYDLMCLDIILPVLGGQEALQKIREVERHYGIVEPDILKVIMVTAIEDFDNISRAFEGGRCEAYLTKPIREEELLEHLEELGLIEGRLS